MTTLISFAALFASIILVQLGSGALAPLDALSGAVLGFSPGQIGMLGSAHYVGFFLGCWVTPRLMATVGHSRTFGGLAAFGTIGALMHPLIIDPWAWSIMRLGTGVAVAGAYTVVESWLHAKTDNTHRGRVFSVFRLVDLSGQMLAQAMIAVLEPAAYVSYNIIALFCALCVVPLTLSRSAAPSADGAPSLRPLYTLRLSPLGAMSAVVAGLSGASFRMVGPVYGAELGLGGPGIALFLGIAVAGGALAQMPIGWLSDAHDRRVVLVAMAVAATLVSLLAALAIEWRLVIYLLAFLFGAATFPLYSIGAAHANDLSGPQDIVTLNASLMFLFGVGAIVSPLVAGELITAYGAGALFLYIAAGHAFLIGFGLLRIAMGPPVPRKTPHTYLPRTSFVLGRLFGERGAKG